MLLLSGKRCIWCLKTSPEISFNKKAHTIPSSLGGQNYNNCVCDNCNEYFGNRSEGFAYSIETALKETFCISRRRLLNQGKLKRQVGKFSSIFFDIKENKGRYKLEVKQSFRFSSNFQKDLCRAFKRGLIKMWFEEFDRQSNHVNGYNDKFKLLRNFSRYNINDIPVIYFERSFGAFFTLKGEAETPVLLLDRMKYLFRGEKFTEIEFLGHVFGFPITDFSDEDFEFYLQVSTKEKKKFFNSYIIIDRLTDIDFTLKIFDER